MPLHSQLPDPLAPDEPEAPDPNNPAPDDEPDSGDDEADLDAIINDLAAAAPVDSCAIEVEGALSYIHDRLADDGDALAVLGLALDRIAERHIVLLRHVARSIASLQAERSHPLFAGPTSQAPRRLEAP